MMHKLNARFRLTAGLVVIAGAAFINIGLSPAHADDEIFSLRQPLNHATVRESVIVRVPRNLLNQSGYATVSVDNQFVAAPMVPDAGDVLWKWNTKDPFQTADNPGSTATISDGNHTILVTLFDKASNEIAKASSTIRLANRITSLPDGVRLQYKWHQDEVVGYSIHSELRNLSDAATDPNSAVPGSLVQVVNAHLDRSVESADSSSVLLRDVVANGQVSDGASIPNDLANAYALKSKYFTVDNSGRLIVDNKPLDPGAHFSFPLPQFPPRRVNVGDSWETDIRASLPWSADKLTTLHGTARLDSFEWENGYPTAKIIENYDGPGQFYIPSSGAANALGAVQAPDIHLSRTVWFAYEGGILVRIESTVTADTMMGSEQYAAISGGGSNNQVAAFNQGGQIGPPAGPPRMNNSVPGGPPAGFVPSGPDGFAPQQQQQQLGNPNQQQQSNQIKLNGVETMILSGVSH